jgi:hypothetical protein
MCAQAPERPATAPSTSFFSRLRKSRVAAPVADKRGVEVEAEQRRLEGVEERATQQCAVGLCKLACFAGKLTIAGAAVMACLLCYLMTALFFLYWCGCVLA